MDYSKILILSDVDSTLAREGQISDENIEAIRSFVGKGGRFSVATGRTARHIYETYMPQLIVNAPLATINGTVIAENDGSEVLWKSPLKKDFYDIVEFIRKNAHDLEDIRAYRSDEVVSCDENFDGNDGHEYFKILAIAKTIDGALEIKKLLREKFGDTKEVLRSWPIGVEIMEKNAGKGVSLRKIKELTKTEIAIGIGDYENDIPLLREADIAVAVGSGIEELKNMADYITVPFEEHALADLINNLDKIVKGEQL